MDQEERNIFEADKTMAWTDTSDKRNLLLHQKDLQK